MSLTHIFSLTNVPAKYKQCNTLDLLEINTLEIEKKTKTESHPGHRMCASYGMQCGMRIRG